MKTKKILVMALVLVVVALICVGIGLVIAVNNMKKEKIETDKFYRSPSVADTIYVLDAETMSLAEQYLAVSLQGIVAQRQPSIYIEFSQQSDTWREDLEINNDIIFVDVGSVWELVSRFSGDIAEMRYVLFDSPETSLNMFNQSVNYAATVAGVERYVMIDSSIEKEALANGLELGKDVRNASTREIFDEYKDKLNPQFLIHQAPDKPHLRDYGIAGKAFCWYSDFDSDTSVKEDILRWADENAPIFGWTENEIDYVEVNSMLSKMTMPADWSSNLSLFSGLSRPETIQQKHTPERIEGEKGKHYVAIVMSDGDNLQWIQNGFTDSAQYFGNPNHGEFKMTWGISPSLYDVAPNMMQYCYDAATENDEFITGPGGGAYVNISGYTNSSLSGYAEYTADYMKKSGMSYVNFIDNYINADALDPFARQENIKGGIWSVGNKYIEGGGSVYWSNGKPFITARETLWRVQGDTQGNKYYGFTERVAQRINGYVKDYTRIEGYTVVIAHAWSIGAMDYVARFVDQLDDSVELVTVGEMIDMVTRYVPKENVETLDDALPGDFDDALAPILSEQYRYDDLKDVTLANGKEFLFTSPSDLGGWKLGNGGLQYDKAVWDEWGRRGSGSIKLEGSDMEDTIDPIPNAWMYAKLSVDENDNYLGIYCRGSSGAATKLRVRAILLENGALRAENLIDGFEETDEYGYYLLTETSPKNYWFSVEKYQGKQVIFSIEQDDDGDGNGEIVYVDAVYLASEPEDEYALSEEKEWKTIDSIFMDWGLKGNVKDDHKEGVCLESTAEGSDEITGYIFNKVKIEQGYTMLHFAMRKFVRIDQEQDADPQVYVYVNGELVKAIGAKTDYVTVSGDNFIVFDFDLSGYTEQEVLIQIGTKKGEHACINQIWLGSE